MAMRRPRMSCQSSSLQASRLRPSKAISPLSVVTVSGNSPISAWAHIDFPDPDSPTTQTISPATRSNETPSTAYGRSLPWGSAIFRFLIETDGGLDISAAALGKPRVERIVEAFADQVQAKDGQQNGETGKHRDPPGLTHHRPPGADHVAPGDQVGIAKPEKRQRGLEQDRGRDHQRGQHDHGRQRVGQNLAPDDP